jgi:hypothetical protein
MICPSPDDGEGWISLPLIDRRVVIDPDRIDCLAYRGVGLIDLGEGSVGRQSRIVFGRMKAVGEAPINAGAEPVGAMVGERSRSRTGPEFAPGRS